MTQASKGADTARHEQDDHAGSPAPSERPAGYLIAISGMEEFFHTEQAARLARAEYERHCPPEADDPLVVPEPVFRRRAESSNLDGEIVEAWNDLPDALRCHPGIKRLYRALSGTKRDDAAESSKAALSDEEIKAAAKQAGFLFHTIPEYAPIQHTLPEEFSERCFYRFARAILARAGIGESRHE